MRVRTIDHVLKLRYSLFDIPFTLSGALLPFASAAGSYSIGSVPPLRWIWIVLAMVFARSAGMAFNEYIDRHIDAKNPRTRARAIPAGEVRATIVCLAAVVFSGLFICSCFAISKVCGLLSIPIIAAIAVYSYLKRITPLCHFFLGLIMGAGPVMAAVAITGTLPVGALWLGLSFFFSITANDVVYGAQDHDFDRKYGVKSLPAWLGIKSAIWVARVLHLLTLGTLFLTGHQTGLRPIYYVAWGAIALVLCHHYYSLRRGRPLQRAFLFCNKAIAILTFTGILGSLAWPA